MRNVCSRNWKRGWWCSREVGHDGPCALRRKLWFRVAHPIRYWGWP